MRYYGDNQHNEISESWQQFDRKKDQVSGAVNPNQVIAVCGRTGETTNADDYEYVAGVEVPRAENIPDGMVVRVVPARRYAVFAHRGPLDTLPDTFKYIYEVWLPRLGHQFADWPELEVYGEAFRDGSPDLAMTIWVPVR